MDLHIHSIYSDGKLTPKEILQTAFRKGIKTISITDHDEITGYHHGKATADLLGITLIPGIELNTDGMDGELHILGYRFDPDFPPLHDYIAWQKKERTLWAMKIVEKLQQLGYNISFASCALRAKGGIIVRTHIADELCEQGYFSSARQAYETLLQKGAAAFIERNALTAQDAIQLIHDAGGEAYLAHPAIYPFPVSMERLMAYGLDGVEAYHSKHTGGETGLWENIAKRFGLKLTGGSDHHGPGSRNPYPIGSVKIGEKCRKQWSTKELIK